MMMMMLMMRMMMTMMMFQPVLCSISHNIFISQTWCSCFIAQVVYYALLDKSPSCLNHEVEFNLHVQHISVLISLIFIHLFTFTQTADASWYAIQWLLDTGLLYLFSKLYSSHLTAKTGFLFCRFSGQKAFPGKWCGPLWDGGPRAAVWPRVGAL